jgi:hypothetical protein
VYLEIGTKRTFACAVDWPGWCRSARDEASALAALLAYGKRYARLGRPGRVGFEPPTDSSAFVVTDRLQGDATTDFGSPGAVPAADLKPADADDVRRFRAILRASWRAFDKIALAAKGKRLRTGPRGGGRDLERILLHVMEAELAYLARLGWQPASSPKGDPQEDLRHVRQEAEKALEYAVTTGLPDKGPRGGKRWKPRYFVRRVAWHVLDHTWEIEDGLA